MNKQSEWMPCDVGDDDYVEINFLPDEKCPKQIRIWARPSDRSVHRTDVRMEIVRDSPSEGSE